MTTGTGRSNFPDFTITGWSIDAIRNSFPPRAEKAAPGITPIGATILGGPPLPPKARLLADQDHLLDVNKSPRLQAVKVDTAGKIDRVESG